MSGPPGRVDRWSGVHPSPRPGPFMGRQNCLFTCSFPGGGHWTVAATGGQLSTLSTPRNRDQSWGSPFRFPSSVSAPPDANQKRPNEPGRPEKPLK
jgi:hypothetical protein